MESKPMYFSRQFINSLKKSIPLEKLIGQYIELKKHGDHFIGLCPFHDDHNPALLFFPAHKVFIVLVVTPAQNKLQNPVTILLS